MGGQGMNHGWAKFSRLTEVKRRPFLQKFRYFWIVLGLAPFLLFSIAVFYDTTFPTGESYAGSSINSTRLDIGLPALRFRRSNVQDDEAARTKEDKEFVQVIQKSGGREFQGFKPDGEEVFVERNSEQFTGGSDGFAEQKLQEEQRAAETAKVDWSTRQIHNEVSEAELDGEQQLIEKDRKGVEDFENEVKELTTEADREKVVEEYGKKEEEEMQRMMGSKQEEGRGGEEQTRREEEQRWREEEQRWREEKQRKSEEALKIQQEKEEVERRLIDEPESKSKVEKVFDIEMKDKMGAHQKKDADESAHDSTSDKKFDIVEGQSQQGSDSNVIAEVVSGTDFKMAETGDEEAQNEQSTEEKNSSDEETKAAADTDQKEEEKHDERQEKARQEEKKVIQVLSPRDEELNKRLGHCNLYDGDWVYDETGPLYSNKTCPYMRDDQNCIANGRPDRTYLHWRWKPRHCDLPQFDAEGFLQAVKGKAVGFVGDSIARNQMQSLLCMLYQVEQPIVQYNQEYESDFTVKYRFEEHDVTLIMVWAPFLVKYSHNPLESYGLGNVLYMDGLHVPWIGRLHEMDIITISIGNWFFQPALYVKNDTKEILGCYRCDDLKNVTDIEFTGIFREALHLGLEMILLERNKIVILTTHGLHHYEHGNWDSGWCRREKPITMEEARGFGWLNEEMRDIVLDEFTKILDARKQGDNNMFFDFLDITKVNLLRADGHPGPYRRPFPYTHKDPSEWVLNDCLHWCMPGPVDTWNQILHKIVERYL